MKILFVVGMPNSGRTTIVEKAKQLGIHTITIDEIIDEEIRKKGLYLTPENKGKVLMWFYENNNELMRRVIDKIISSRKDKILVEGFISPKQINGIKERLRGTEITILGVHRPPGKRLKTDGFLKNEDRFRKLDGLFLDMGTPEVMVMADYIINNDGDLGDFRRGVKDKLIDILNIKER